MKYHQKNFSEKNENLVLIKSEWDPNGTKIYTRTIFYVFCLSRSADQNLFLVRDFKDTMIIFIQSKKADFCISLSGKDPHFICSSHKYYLLSSCWYIIYRIWYTVCVPVRSWLMAANHIFTSLFTAVYEKQIYISKKYQTDVASYIRTTEY